MVASRLTGLQSLLQYASKKPSVSGYYLNGFLRLTSKHWLCLVQASVVAEVPECAQKALLKDPRVALHAVSMRQDMVGKVNAVAALPSEVWSLLGSLCGTNGIDLMSACIQASHKALAFFEFRVLSAAEGLPWSLCRGDISWNLEQLKDGSCPEHSDVASKAWQLLQMGHSRTVLIRMVELLADVPWSTQVAEQLHGSAAVVSRFHPEYSLDTLMCRAMILASAKLLPSPSTCEKRIAKARKGLQQLARRNPAKAGAKQVYFGDLCKVAADKYEASILPRVRKIVMNTHSQAFKSHPFNVRFAYSRRALAAAQEKKIAIQKQRLALHAELQVALEESRSEASLRKPLTLSSSAWKQAELDHFQSLLEGSEFSGSQVLQLREMAVVAPFRPGASLVSTLDQQAIEQEESLAVVPLWVQQIVRHRDFFSDCALAFQKDEQEFVYKITFAIQQPLALWVSPMSLAEHYLDLTETGPSFQHWPRFDYQCNFGSNLNIMSVKDLDPEHIRVVAGLSYLADGTCSSVFIPRPLPEVLSTLPATPAKSASSSSSSSAEKKPPLEDWAEKLLQSMATKHKSHKVVVADVLEHDREAFLDGEEVLHDPDIMLQLAKVRQSFLEAKEDRCLDFQVTILGGQWTAAHKGVAADAFSAAAKGNMAIQWCKRRAIPQSARYEISLYGQEAAAAMARCWASKMQYMFNICIQLEDELHKLTASELKQWPCPSEFFNLRTELAGSRKGLHRLDQIQVLA